MSNTSTYIPENKVITFNRAQKQQELLSDKTFEEIFSISDTAERHKKIEELRQKSISAEYRCKSKFEKKLKQKEQEYSLNTDLQNTYIFEELELNIGNYYIDGKSIQKNGKIISQQLIYPSAIYQNVSTGSQKVELKFKCQSKWETRVIERAKCIDKNRIKEEANFGLDMSNASGLAEYINYLLINNEHIIPYKKAVTHLGWNSHEFINEKGELETKTEFLPFDINTVFDGDSAYLDGYNAIRYPKGDFEKWKENVAEFRKNIVIRLTTDCSFASSLLKLTGSLPFVFLIYGRTGKGKTVALQIGASIWGDPSYEKLINNLDSTKNSEYKTMAFYHSIPSFFDELQLYTGDKNLLVMILCSAKERSRLNKDGGAQKKGTWNNCALLSGEETISNSGSGGGVINRLIEVDIDDVLNGGSLFSKTKLSGKIEPCKYASEFIAKKNYGHAGREFIKFIKELGQEKIFDMYQERFDELKAFNISEDKQIGSMANILLADDIVNMFMFNEERLKAEDVKRFLFSKEEIDPSEKAYNYLWGEITKNMSCFVKKDDTGKNGVIDENIEYKREFWGLATPYYILILRTQLDKILQQDKNNCFNPKKMLGDWSRKGYIELNSEGKFNIRTTVKALGGGATNFIKLLPKKEQEKEVKKN